MNEKYYDPNDNDNDNENENDNDNGNKKLKNFFINLMN